MTALCACCGGSLPRPAATGRPRKYCRACADDRGTLARAWRAAHVDQVVAYRAEWRRQRDADRASKADKRANELVAAIRAYNAARRTSA